ncbi:hypothetical protein FDG2_4781 [Candidatus Protofrankia californiensis]|uniref:Uncharacterized protein n=1 Tax=Candidatus Protofrankia californiensis TaxID=1839754 RepID=A0A1C3P8V3_9ACTN|nr:hypothetical protein FDG2_4781 [Candidatus Protofrankia californiensis]
MEASRAASNIGFWSLGGSRSTVNLVTVVMGSQSA